MKFRFLRKINTTPWLIDFSLKGVYNIVTPLLIRTSQPVFIMTIIINKETILHQPNQTVFLLEIIIIQQANQMS